ncbi:MAG: hypothetical protein OEZ10_00790 [Gammaproteobacteria bacterium]|nr:hypothetical protein [Gammaproteobacteria bacterium]
MILNFSQLKPPRFYAFLGITLSTVLLVVLGTVPALAALIFIASMMFAPIYTVPLLLTVFGIYLSVSFYGNGFTITYIMVCALSIVAMAFISFDTGNNSKKGKTASSFDSFDSGVIELMATVFYLAMLFIGFLIFQFSAIMFINLINSVYTAIVVYCLFLWLVFHVYKLEFKRVYENTLRKCKRGQGSACRNINHARVVGTALFVWAIAALPYLFLGTDPFYSGLLERETRSLAMVQYQFPGRGLSRTEYQKTHFCSLYASSGALAITEDKWEFRKYTSTEQKIDALLDKFQQILTDRSWTYVRGFHNDEPANVADIHDSYTWISVFNIESMGFIKLEPEYIKSVFSSRLRSRLDQARNLSASELAAAYQDLVQIGGVERVSGFFEQACNKIDEAAFYDLVDLKRL